MNEKDLRDIIAQVLSEMNVTDTASATSAAPAQKADTASAATEDGFVEDVAEIDIKTQYLVENPVAKDAYYELKQYAPCRLGIGKAGARYKTLPVLEFRAAHSAAQDAVFTDVDPEVIEKLGLFTVQIYVSDGLSSAAVAANTADVLPAILQGLKSYGIEAGTPFFVKYGRVGVMDQISEITGADVTCVLIGERPGLITAESMSAYIAYKATVGMPEARRTVVSNIHKDGTIPAEAGAHIADIIKKILEAKASGTDLKL